MGVKNNFSQAVSELIGISRTIEPDQKKDITEAGAVEEGLAPAANPEAAPEVKDASGEIADQETKSESAEEQTEDSPQVIQNPKERIMAMLAAQQTQQQGSARLQVQPQPQPVPPQEQVDAAAVQNQRLQQRTADNSGVTTIAKGTVIIGEINADGDVELLGSIKGKVSAKGNIKANGKVIGDLTGRDVELIACAVQGNIAASGMVTVDGDSVVIGDVKGDYFCLDGKIKGNVTVEKEAKFQPKAILAGNVTTASIAMSQGAKIQGEVNIPLSEKDTDMTFDIDMKI